jgi:hypothetical protein
LELIAFILKRNETSEKSFEGEKGFTLYFHSQYE